MCPAYVQSHVAFHEHLPDFLHRLHALRGRSQAQMPNAQLKWFSSWCGHAMACRGTLPG